MIGITGLSTVVLVSYWTMLRIALWILKAWYYVNGG
jgi:hypothetical protein